MSQPLRFENVEIRPEQRLLVVDGLPVALGARAFDVLVALTERADRALSKAELLDRAWPGLVVEENNLQVQISTLRKVLGPRAIATIPGRGYQFTLAPAPDQAPVVPLPLVAGGTGEAPASTPTNLPCRQAPLFGRSDEMAAVDALVRQHGVVTIVGAGGMGKTRLAQAAAAALGESFPDGIWWVELAASSDPALVPSALARACGAQASDARGSLESALAVLASQRALLVLDNCEHLLDAVASVVESVRARAPGVHVLVTSQEPLRVPDEQMLRLGPLALPVAEGTDAAASGAAELFVARARALDAGFAASVERMPAIAEICRRLDGIPLAIELAAARLPLLGLEGLCQRLDERFKVLTAGSRVVLRRHQTLRATLDWSHGLLSAEEQTVLRRIGAFAGSFTLESAERVAGDERIDRWAVLEHLGALVDKSIVLAEGDPVPRYRLLETTRIYAVEKLAEAGETSTTLRQHALAVVAFLGGYERKRWQLNREDRSALSAELDNLRAAMAWADSDDVEAELAVTLAALSRNVWISTNLVHEGLERCLAVRRRLDATTPAAIEALFWLTISRLGNISSRVESFVAGQRAADAFRRLGDVEHLHEALASLAASAAERGAIEAAVAAVEEAGRIERPEFTLRQRASLAFARQRSLSAAGRIEEALEAALRQAALCREDAFEVGEMIASGANIAGCEIGLGRLEAAEARSRHALQRLVALGANQTTGHVRYSLVLSLALQGRPAEARDEARLALPLLRTEGDELRLLDALAIVAAQAGRPDDAARVVGFMELQRTRGGGVEYPVRRARRERLEALLASTLPADELAARRAEGAGLSADAVFASAFGDA